MALTKAQLEALKNSLLASQQPIIASTHRELIQNIIDEMYDAQSRGNLLAGVQQNGTTTTGDTIVLIRSGQAYLVPTSLFTEVAGDFVTRNTTQTITGAKTFENELVRIEGINPEIRLRASSNKSAIKFRTLTNEDNGQISYDDSEKKLSINTSGDNADIVIYPNGTGKVNLPNIPDGTGESLMRDTEGNIVKGFSSAGFKAKGVRTQTGFYNSNISGTTPVGIFQTPFSWIAAYFSVGTVIEIDLVGTIGIGQSSSFSFNLRIGEENYSLITVGSGSAETSDEVFNITYKITLSSSNEIKISGNLSIFNNYKTFQTATKNMNDDFDIDIIGRFGQSSSLNVLKSNLITVKVY
jgi:hypothetical protein